MANFLNSLFWSIYGLRPSHKFFCEPVNPCSVCNNFGTTMSCIGRTLILCPRTLRLEWFCLSDQQREVQSLDSSRRCVDCVSFSDTRAFCAWKGHSSHSVAGSVAEPLGMKWLACPGICLDRWCRWHHSHIFQALIPSDDNVFLSLINQALRGHQLGAH